MRRVLVIDGHPAERSLSRALAEAYAEGAAEAGAQVRLLHLSAMRFDPDFAATGYKDQPPLEPDLLRFLEDFEWAEHVALVCPLWWGGAPAKLKGLLDRALLPGRAFDPRDPDWLTMPRKLMTGRSAYLMVTSDTPDPFFALVYGWGFRRLMARQVFGFIGVRPMRWRNLAIARRASPGRVAGWIERARAEGRAGR